ncbi:MAG: glutathione S-transferase family protein [Alphaproteobacteria bacterium]|nr:glutathione S-transferase family protein [Alphaproteobacteria bacterium]
MSDLTIILGNKNYSSWSLRAWLALKHTGAEHDEIVIPLYRDDYLDEIRRHSPSGKVPALRHGDTVVWESLAIAEYLAELFPMAGLWPTDREPRAVARAISAEMHAGFTALRTHLPMNIRGRFPGHDYPPEVQQDINRITAIWRDCRTRFSGEGPFLFGDFTIADAMFAPVVWRFNTYEVKLGDGAAAYCEAIKSWPGMHEWVSAAEGEPWIIDSSEF